MSVVNKKRQALEKTECIPFCVTLLEHENNISIKLVPSGVIVDCPSGFVSFTEHVIVWCRKIFSLALSKSRVSIAEKNVINKRLLETKNNHILVQKTAGSVVRKRID